MDPKPKIAITLGDPAGIGPEIVAKICQDEEVLDAAELLVVGRKMLLSAGALAGALKPPQVRVEETGEGTGITPGRPSAAGGRQAGAFIEKAFQLCRSGQVQAMVTAPISKSALRDSGYPDTGHTSLLARLSGADPVMMMAGKRLKVVLATIHKALSQVPTLLSKEKIVEVGRITHHDLVSLWGLEKPRIAVAGLNPHAGEAGMFGVEEQNIIGPAVEEMKSMGIQASGPHPPDTVFWHAVNGAYDVVLCMYHDQGLIPFKLCHFEDGVNVTLGLPIIRTSPDHGTAYEIAGQGKANPASLKSAVLLAARLARVKARRAG